MPTDPADVFDVELELAVSSIFGLETMESFAESIEQAEEIYQESDESEDEEEGGDGGEEEEDQEEGGEGGEDEEEEVVDEEEDEGDGEVEDVAGAATTDANILEDHVHAVSGEPSLDSALDDAEDPNATALSSADAYELRKVLCERLLLLTDSQADWTMSSDGGTRKHHKTLGLTWEVIFKGSLDIPLETQVTKPPWYRRHVEQREKFFRWLLCVPA